MNRIRWRFTGERLVPGSAWLQPMRVENLARFRFFAQHVSGARVLDLGCGAGEGTDYLRRERAWNVTGVDIATDALMMARREYGAATVFGAMDVDALAFADASFDAVVSVEVIEHLSTPKTYLCEARRVLRSQGVFFLTTPNRLRSSPRPELRWPEHVLEYSPNELVDLLCGVFKTVELWGEYVPIFERHPLRRLVRHLAPALKPWLPHWLRVRALPLIQTSIRPSLSLDDVLITRSGIDDAPTLLAMCK
jgi:SAM-dependent methyltransferase